MRQTTGGTAYVTGATGLTGRAVVEVLREQGARVTAHVRPDSPRLPEWTERLSAIGAQVDSTPWDEPAMQAMLAALKPTRVFALLGTTAKRARAARAGGVDASYEAIDYGLTALLYRAASACSPPPTFVYLSSLGVSDRSRGAYMKARAKVERMLREGSVPYIIARPSFIVGDRDARRPMEKVGASLGDAALSVIGAVGARRTASRLQSLTGRDLARGLVAVSAEPDAPGRIFDSADLREAAHSL